MDLYDLRRQLSGGTSIYDIPLRVSFYARVSTEKDEQLHSLSAQIQYYSDLIQSCPAWTYVEGYVDEGLSGTSVGKRESFLRMLQDARAGRFDFLLTKEISRFSRNTLDSIRYTQELLACGVGVLFQSDNINTLLPDAELRLTILSSIAQDEVRKISERVRFGFQRAMENGVVLGNDRIWGYRKDKGKLVIDEEEAKMVRLIFDLYADQRLGIRAVAQALTDRGYRNQNGGSFSYSTVRGILTNPKYKGFYCGGKSAKYDYKHAARKRLPQEEWLLYEDPGIPAIVSPELWDKAAALLSSRAGKCGAGQGSGQTRYPYSGKLLCAAHQAPYYRALYRYPSGSKEVWQCREYSRHGKMGCSSPILYTSDLDGAVRMLLRRSGLSGVEVTESLLGIYAGVGKTLSGGEERRRAEARLLTLEKRLDCLLDLSVEGRLSSQEFTQRSDTCRREMEEQRRLLRQMEAEGNADREREAERRRALEGLWAFEEGFSAGVVDALVERVEVFPGREGEKALLRLYPRLEEGSLDYAL